MSNLNQLIFIARSRGACLRLVQDPVRGCCVSYKVPGRRAEVIEDVAQTAADLDTLAGAMLDRMRLSQGLEDDI